MEKAGLLSENCLNEAAQWAYLMSFCNVTHLILFIGNAYREIFSAQTDMFG